jgi:DNA modification methylase
VFLNGIQQKAIGHNMKTIEYQEFLQNKVPFKSEMGIGLVDLCEINPALKPHNKLMVKWMVEGGQRACFASFGLHKTVTQLETLRIILTRTGGRALIICPLGVKAEFQNDAVRILNWDKPPKFIRRIEEADETGIYLTNYETIRDGKMDPRLFQVVSLDEASVLRGLGGSKTFREFMRLFTGDAGPNKERQRTNPVKYRFVATATPAPNDYIEILAYADFLGVMDVSQAKTRFFKRDSTKADKLTIHKHKEEEFWLWVCSWALFVTKPSDLTGDPADDQGYIFPKLDLRWHEIPSDHTNAGVEKNGQMRLLKDAAIGLGPAAKEKRDSLNNRLAKMLELREEDPFAHRIIWHDLEAERHAIRKAIPTCKIVYGKQDLDDREEIVSGFSNGTISEIGGKPSMIGSGTNLQRHCHWAIYLGIGFKFNDFIQSIHRLLRFLQTHVVRIDLIYTESEREVRRTLEKKWTNHNKMIERMIEIIKEYGLSHAAMAQLLTRKIGVERVELKGKQWTAINNDNVLESKSIASNSIGLHLTSVPFSMQYEYSPNYADFGHNDSNDAFFRQMDYLIPDCFRTLMPGRLMVVHVKDRIIPGGINGMGFQTVYPFHMDVKEHFTTCPNCRIRIAIAKHRGKKYKRCTHLFEYLGMKTIVTDVVRENSQTYRLGWSEQCKDGSKMGVGMPEYLLIFRKPPTDNSNAYADIPVFKNKPLQVHEDGSIKPFDKTKTLPLVPKSGYSRSRWQIDAHGFTRTDGNRLLTPEEFTKLEHDAIFQMFKKYTLENVYDFEYHVSVGEALEATGKLPSSFMLLQPQSWSDEVWTDITRMLTLNGAQHAKGKEMHLCPMQTDLAKRVIVQMSNPGDLVADFFAGLFTVPLIAIQNGRRGLGIELNPSYFLDGVCYMKAEDEKMAMPTLFDAINEPV